ncbi:MAG: SGNH/GDSL hydrolase family protein [Phycisphaera sp. RhM]|nr:SGNH/GDSL hydrolase family protein [Phycisphaera sp. RhM]
MFFDCKQATVFALIAFVSVPLDGAEPEWVTPMRAVHVVGDNEPGVIVNIGDSITYSMAYFAPLQYLNEEALPPAVSDALETVNEHIKSDCYRWKGPDKGNQGGQTAGWALTHIDQWIETLKPEVALIMFGTNDVRRGSIEQHEQNLRRLVKRCLDQGVVVILSTIPPMHGFEEKVEQAVQSQRRVARDLKVPLIDLYAHIIRRRPDDWNGTLPQFTEYDQWQVPTLISKDGVHLSNPDRWREDYTEEGLATNGNTLRNFLSLMAYSEVIDVVIHGDPPSWISKTLLGAEPSLSNRQKEGK